MTAARLATLAWAALVIVIAAGSLFGVLGNGFVWDDGPFIVWNESLEGPGTLQRIIARGDSFGIRGENPYYRPVTMLSFAIDRWLFGDNPVGYHATNLLLHLAVCVLVFLAALGHAGRPVVAGAASLLFAVHPAVVEPVAYVSARADLLCAAFMLVAWLLHVRGRRSGSPACFAIAALAFAVALFAKIVAVALLPLLVLREVLLERPGERRFRSILLFAVPLGVFLLARVLVLEKTSWECGVPFLSRLATAGSLLLVYLGNVVLPFQLQVFYDAPVRTSWADPAVIGAWAVLAGCAVIWLLLFRRRPAVALWMAWFFVALFPVSGVVDFLYPALMADRYLYVPLAGGAIAVAGLIRPPAAGRCPRPPARRFAAAAAGSVALIACVSAFSLTTARRVPVWRDPVTLWEQAHREAPAEPYVLNKLGSSYWRANRLGEAERVLAQAAAINPDDVSPMVNLTAVAFLQGDLAAAERYAEQALRLDPGHSVALRYRGRIYEKRGRRDLAIASLQAALAADPFDGRSRRALSDLLTTRNEL